jgi:hypothetical protein
MPATSLHLKVAAGIGLTWLCAGLFYFGLTHASLDGAPFVFSAYDDRLSLLLTLSAPVAQSAFYILARRTNWLLNVYLALSVASCAVAGLGLATGGYRFSYWHQGDYHCLQGCDDVWLFGLLVLVQGFALMFPRTVFEGLSTLWRAGLRLVLSGVLIWLFLSSCAIAISM